MKWRGKAGKDEGDGDGGEGDAHLLRATAEFPGWVSRPPVRLKIMRFPNRGLKLFDCCKSG